MARFRRASGGREEGLLKRAEALRKSVDPLLPERTRECPPEPFDRLAEHFEEVREAKDDEKRLIHLSKWGEPFARAYAGFLHFYLEPELPVLLPARVGGSEISYAPLARTTAQFQIAVQQHNDPRRLLLGYLDLAHKGFYFYALPERLLCTGKDPTPPAEFLRKQDSALPYRLEKAGEDGGYFCPHLAHGDPVPWVGVEWTSADRRFRVCRACARTDGQLLGALAAGMAQPRAEDAFAVDAQMNVDCRGGPDCIHHHLPELSRGLRRRYTEGRFSDQEFLEAFVGETAPYIARTSQPLYIAGGVCYGQKAEAFIDALHPNRVERAALVAVLPEVGGLFDLESPTASQALERLWRTKAEEVVAAIEPDPAEAARLVAEARAAPGRVSELLRRAAQRAEEREKLAELPQYHALGPEAAFVDGTARLYRTGGATAAERHLEQATPREGKQRGLAWALLCALERAGPHTWQFSDTERRFGESLVEPARRVLDVPAREYGAALAALLTSAGVAGELR